MEIPYQHWTGADVRHWLGLPEASFANNHADLLILTRGTLPTEASKYENALILTRVWVSVNVSGQVYQLDPSFKIYQQVSGIDLASASGYQQSTALGQLAGTVADSNLSIKSANETALGNFLRDRTTNLLQTLKQSVHAFRTPVEVTGGWRLQEWTAASLWEAFPLNYYYLETSTWNEVPADRVATLNLRLGTNPTGGQVSLSLSKPLPDLAGRRLTLEFAKSGSNTKAQIWLDDELWAKSPTTSQERPRS